MSRITWHLQLVLMEQDFADVFLPPLSAPHRKKSFWFDCMLTIQLSSQYYSTVESNKFFTTGFKLCMAYLIAAMTHGSLFKRLTLLVSISTILISMQQQHYNSTPPRLHPLLWFDGSVRAGDNSVRLLSRASSGKTDHAWVWAGQGRLHPER